MKSFLSPEATVLTSCLNILFLYALFLDLLRGTEAGSFWVEYFDCALKQALPNLPKARKAWNVLFGKDAKVTDTEPRIFVPKVRRAILSRCQLKLLAFEQAAEKTPSAFITK